MIVPTCPSPLILRPRPGRGHPLSGPSVHTRCSTAGIPLTSAGLIVVTYAVPIP
jgi:hypothetical protein